MKIVKCRYCNEEKNIQLDDQKTFFCCGHVQRIGRHTLVDSVPNTLLKKPNSDDEEIKKEGKVENIETPLEVTEDLEIEEAEHENPIESLEVEAPKEFSCPNCHQKLNEYQAICENCKFEITWQ